MQDQELREIFCNNLKRVISQRGLSYSAIERKAGIISGSIHRILTTSGLPRIKMAIQLAKALNVSLGELMQGEEQDTYFPNMETLDNNIIFDKGLYYEIVELVINALKQGQEYIMDYSVVTSIIAKVYKIYISNHGSDTYIPKEEMIRFILNNYLSSIKK